MKCIERTRILARKIEPLSQTAYQTGPSVSRSTYRAAILNMAVFAENFQNYARRWSIFRICQEITSCALIWIA
jgi:hypothetical protein